MKLNFKNTLIGMILLGLMSTLVVYDILPAAVALVGFVIFGGLLYAAGKYSS